MHQKELPMRLILPNHDWHVMSRLIGGEVVACSSSTAEIRL